MTTDSVRGMTATYVAVIVIQILVLSGLWALGRYFGS